MRIRDAFKAHGVFINVFYSPLRSFVLERVRTRLFLDEQREIPVDFKALYEEAAEHLKTEALGPGQSGLIQKLLLLPISGVANMLATFGSSFTVIYDPREKREDKAVIAAIDGVLAAFLNLKDKGVEMRWDLHDFVKGFVHDRRSEDEIGLQMADLMAGETRAFFDANPEQMEFAASRKLITQGAGRALGYGRTRARHVVEDRRAEPNTGGGAQEVARAGPVRPHGAPALPRAFRRRRRDLLFQAGGSLGTSRSSRATLLDQLDDDRTPQFSPTPKSSMNPRKAVLTAQGDTLSEI